MTSNDDRFWFELKASESSALGPQLSYRSTFDSEEGYLFNTKTHIVKKHGAQYDAHYRVIENVLNGVSDMHGSGTSTTKFLCISIAIELMRLEFTSHQLLSALSIFETSFKDTCKSLSFNSWVNNNGTQAVDNQPTQCSNDDDTSWFFDDSNVTTQPDNNILSCGSTLSVQKEELNNGMLFLGLDHCISSDWNFCDINLHSNTTATISLPMQLAMKAATHLWSFRSNEDEDVSSLSIFASKLYEVKSKELLLKNSNIKAFHNNCLKQSLDQLYFTVLHGLPMSYSRAITNGVLFGCSDDDITNAVQVTNSKINGAQFNRIAMVCPEYSTFDNPIESSEYNVGTSQEAKKVNVTVTHTVESFITSHRNDEQTNSINKCIAHLCSLNVNLLLCFDDIRTSRLVDACLAASIVVLSMSRQKLLSVSKLCGASIVENILELSDELIVDNCILKLERVTNIPKQDTMTSMGVDVNEEELVTDDINNHTVLVSLEAVEMNYSDKTDLSGDCVCDFVNCHCDNVMPVSVLLCATTPLMASTLKDRFNRCLNRIRSAVDTSTVIPGGGVPELVCYLHLDEIIAEKSNQLLNNFNSDVETDSSDDYVIIEILKSVQRVLLDYCYTILTNNGCEYSNALQFVEEAKLSLLHSYFTHQHNCKTPVGILEFVSSLSAEQKCNLMKPINLEKITGLSNAFKDACTNNDERSSNSSSSTDDYDENVNNVLDVPAIKCNSVSAALTIIRQLFIV